MPTGIRFPGIFKPPDRDQVQSDYGKNSMASEFEIGLPRQRRTSTVQPRLEKVSWTLSQAEYLIFDLFWHNTIKQGALDFDIELSDDAGGLIWYTVKWVGGYQAQLDYTRYEWNVSGTLRLEEEPFATRPVGTDELNGSATVGINGTGLLVVTPILRGVASVGISTATLRFGGGTLAGSMELGIDGTAYFEESILEGSVGIAGTGKFDVSLRGSSEVGIASTSKFDVSLRGSSEVGITGTGQF